jgi:hypothetical protein
MTIDTAPTSQRAHSLSTEQLSVGTARGTQYPAPLTTSKRQQVAKAEKTIITTTTTGFQNISTTEVCGRPRLAGAPLLGALASGALAVGAPSSPALAGATRVSVDQLARSLKPNHHETPSCAMHVVHLPIFCRLHRPGRPGPNRSNA